MKDSYFNSHEFDDFHSLYTNFIIVPIAVDKHTYWCKVRIRPKVPHNVTGVITLNRDPIWCAIVNVLGKDKY